MRAKVKIRSFTDLNAWKESHKLVLLIYKVTKSFPKEEIFGLTSQMRRCAISISSNIAEGFTRKSSKEKIQFYFMAKGSLTELNNQIIIARDIKYLTKDKFQEINDLLIVVHKLINGLIRNLRKD
jgi:four helix bundle protein